MNNDSKIAPPIPTNSPEGAEARKVLFGEIVSAFCVMDLRQRRILFAALVERKEHHLRSETEMQELCKDATPETIEKLIRFTKAMLNDDLAELKAIKEEASENWPETLNETITDLEQDKREMQPDLSISEGITLDEKLEVLLKHLEVLRFPEINAALKLIDMTGVKL